VKSKAELGEDTAEDVKEEKRNTRSGRMVRQPNRSIEQDHLILHQTDRNNDRYFEYEEDIAIVAARTIGLFNCEVSQKGALFSQQYILQKGLKKFGEEGRHAATEEHDQLHRRNVSNPLTYQR
jgi:hypothetical protein